jgi:hypothetical protein
MRLYELDAPDDDEWVGDLDFPDLHVDLTCDEAGCEYATSDSVSPTEVWGNYDDPYAEIFMIVDAELIEATTPVPDDSAAANLAALLAGERGLPDPVGIRVVSTAAGLSLGGAGLRNGLRRPLSQESQDVLDLKVVDAEDGTPIDEATILFIDELAGEIVVNNVRSSVEGRTAIKPVPMEDLELFVTAHGYGPAHRQLSNTPGGTVELTRAGRLTGFVTDTRGVPIGSAEIVLETPPEAASLDGALGRVVSVGSYGRTILSDARSGVFELRNIEANVMFQIKVLHPAYGAVTIGPMSLTPGESLSGLHITLARAP